MGQVGQLALGIVGAVIGGLASYGNPMAIQAGFMIGAAIGGLVFPPKTPAPRINDLRLQDSAYGKFIPRVYGLFRVGGNLMWAGQPSQHTSGGKGAGGKGPQQTTVTMSFAIGLCEGPIKGVRRIWANGKLIYDISNPSNFEAISGSNQMVSNFKVYDGDETQLPDPTMEAALGVGNVPAHRGLAYVVFNELDLSPWGSYLPSFSFEVVTNVQPTYTGATMSTYTQTPGQDMGQISGLTPQGATFMSLGYWTNYSGLYVGQLTPYGSSFTNPYSYTAKLTPANAPQWVAEAGGWADEPGMLCPDSVYGVWGWYKPDGTVMLGAAGLPSWVAGTGRNYIKNGVWLYATAAVAGPDWAIVKCSLMPTDSDGLALAGQTGQIVAATPPTYCVLLLGVTSSYLYAVDVSAETTRGSIYQFDENTLALVNTWPGSGLDSSWLGSSSAGHVVDDRHIYTYGAGRLYVFDAVSGVLTKLAEGLSVPTPSMMQVVSPGYILLGSGGGSNASFSYLQLSYSTMADASVPLSTVVADICQRAGLSPSQYDVSQLTDRVTGYAITTNATPRDDLAVLMAAYFFDVTDSDDKLKFVMRGGAVAGTFAYADLGASNSVGDDANSTPIQVIRLQEIDLPKSLALTYIGARTDYHPGTQVAFRTTTLSNKESAANLAVVLTDDQAMQKAQSLLWATWLAREQFTFQTTLAYLKYEPNDVVTLEGDGVSYTVRLTSCGYDAQGVLKWGAVSELPAVYTSTAVGAPQAGFTPQTIAYAGATSLAVLDVPPLRDQDTSPGLYLAASGYDDSWPGCIVEISRDGLSFTDLIGISQASVIGTALNALPSFGGGNQPDELSTVTVNVLSGSLSSVTYANFLAGANAAIIGNEIVYFRNATLTAANTYQLSGFLRGLAGTDWAMAAHGNGDRFVFLDPSKIVAAGINSSDLGTTLYFEARLANINGTQPGPKQTLVPVNERVQPLSPVMFRARKGSAASTSDISLFWTRRARVNASWRNGADVPLDQQTESYTLTVKNGATTVRTVIVTAAQTYVYTAANIAADGFSAGNTISFSIYQNSDLGVPGRAATASIVR
ncbi:phage tail protein [Cupriavidus necator]